MNYNSEHWDFRGFLRKIKTNKISSTSLPGGNLVDGLPPASSVHSFSGLVFFPEGSDDLMSTCKWRTLYEG